MTVHARQVQRWDEEGGQPSANAKRAIAKGSPEPARAAIARSLRRGRRTSILHHGRCRDRGDHQLHEYVAILRSCWRRVCWRKRRSKGLEGHPPWVKSSLAPGSRVVTDYLTQAGLQPYLDKLGFNLVGYGCTTCIGNSGPLPRRCEEGH